MRCGQGPFLKRAHEIPVLYAFRYMSAVVMNTSLIDEGTKSSGRGRIYDDGHLANTSLTRPRQVHPRQQRQHRSQLQE